MTGLILFGAGATQYTIRNFAFYPVCSGKLKVFLSLHLDFA